MAAGNGAGMRPIGEMGGRTKFIVMAGTLLGLFTASMDQTVVGTSMPRIVAQLGGFGLFSWVGTGFMLASTTAVPIVGKLTDMYGRKPFYMAGILILIMGSALSGSSQNIEQLIAFRVVQGLGAGMIMGIAFAIVGDVFTPAERARWAGVMSGVFASASVIGPVIGGTLTDHAHWRWVFYVNLPLGGLALAVLFFGMPNLRPAATAKMDYRGILLLVASVVPMLLALSWAGSRYSWGSMQIVGFLGWAMLALVLFAYAEMRTGEPLFPMSLFRDRIFLVSSIVTFLTGFAMFGSLFYIPLFVQGVIGSSATNSGFVTMPMMIAMAIASGAAGQIMSRFGRYRILGIIGLLIVVGGTYMLSTMSSSSTVMDARLGMVVLGVGLGISMPLFTLAVQNAVPYRTMGIATSTIQFVRSVGGTMGVAVMFSLIQGHYHDGLRQAVPQPVQSQPQLAHALNDPQFLLDANALGKIRQAFDAFGADGHVLLGRTMLAVKDSLADGIAAAFFFAIFVMAVSVLVAAFMKEVPLRRAHYLPEEVAALAAEAEPRPQPTPRLRPAPADGEATPGQTLFSFTPLTVLAAGVAVVVVAVLRLARRKP